MLSQDSDSHANHHGKPSVPADLSERQRSRPTSDFMKLSVDAGPLYALQAAHPNAMSLVSLLRPQRESREDGRLRRCKHGLLMD